MSLLGLFGSGGLLDSKEPQGLLGKHFSPNQAMLSMGLGMLGNGWAGALPGLQAGLKSQREADQQRQGVTDWNTVLGGMGGGSGAPQGGMGMPSVPAPMVGIGGPSPASPAGGMRAQSGGVPGNYGGVVDRIVGIESGGNPNARSTTSSATGAGQFIDSTWLSTVKKHRPDVAAGKSDPQILSLRTDPNLSREMIAAYAQDNAGFLQSRGLGTGPTEVYAAHNLGPAGAAKVLSAAPDTPLSSMFGADVMRANPHLRNMTARTYLQSIGGKMGGGDAPSAGAPAAGGGAMPSPEQQQAFVAGLPPERRQALARLASQNPQVASAIMQQMFSAQQGTDDQREFLFSVQRGEFKGTFPEWQAAKRQGASGYTLGRDQVRYDSQNRVVAQGPERASPNETFDQEGKLRGEFTKALTEFNTVQDAFGRVAASVQERAKNPEAVSPASDIALVFGFMKMLDPASVVREGEYATAQNAAGVPERIRNVYNKAVDGEFLTDTQRQDMVDTSGRLYGQARQTAEAVGARYRDLATGYQVDPNRVVSIPQAIELPKVGQAESPAAAPAPAPAIPPAAAPSPAPAAPPPTGQRTLGVNPRFAPRQYLDQMETQDLPLARTPEEARKLPSGTWFRNPQNERLLRP